MCSALDWLFHIKQLKTSRVDANIAQDRLGWFAIEKCVHFSVGEPKKTKE
jgi:hypothetical protein